MVESTTLYMTYQTNLYSEKIILHMKLRCANILILKVSMLNVFNGNKDVYLVSRFYYSLQVQISWQTINFIRKENKSFFLDTFVTSINKNGQLIHYKIRKLLNNYLYSPVAFMNYFKFMTFI